MTPTRSIAFAAILLVCAVGQLRAQPGGPSPPDMYSLDLYGSYGPGFLTRYAWIPEAAMFRRSLVWQPPLVPTPPITYSALLDADNETVLVLWRFPTGPFTLSAVRPSGQTTTLFTDPRFYFSLPAIDQTGDLVFHVVDASDQRHLVRMDRAGNLLATIASFSRPGTYSTPQHVVVDLESGDYLVTLGAGASWGAAWITPSGQVSPVVGLESVTCAWGGPPDPDYRLGAQLARIAGSRTTPFWGDGWRRMHFLPSYYNAVILPLPYVGSGSPGGTALYTSTRVFGFGLSPIPGTPTVVEVPATGGQPRTYAVEPWVYPIYSWNYDAPIIVGHRKLVGRGLATPGSEYQVSVNFPGQAGLAYRIGASLGLRPGLDLGSAYIPLRLDPVLLWSLSDPTTFAGFAGTLDANARATGRWRIPPIAGLRGLRVFFAAVTFDGNGLRSVSDPIGVTVR